MRATRIANRTSILLDSLRITAALVVYASHCAQLWSSAAFKFLGPLAFGAVVVFFVLSGYVIAAATLSSQSTASSYIVSRLSRLYSTVLPALVVGAVLEIIGRRVNPEFYGEFSRGYEALRYVAATLFLQNVWWISASPPTNPPLWSLCYEFWYYALFGAAVFVRGRAMRVWVVLLVALMAGPNVVLLLPCWLIGVVVYLAGRDAAGSTMRSYLLFVAALASFLLFVYVIPAYPNKLGTAPNYFSAAFVSDWLLALAIGLMIAGFDARARSSRSGRMSDSAVALLRGIADHTFPLYLYHFPILVFVTAIIPPEAGNPIQKLLMAACILVIILWLSVATEAHRGRFKAAFQVIAVRGRAALIDREREVRSPRG